MLVCCWLLVAGSGIPLTLGGGGSLSSSGVDVTLIWIPVLCPFGMTLPCPVRLSLGPDLFPSLTCVAVSCISSNYVGCFVGVPLLKVSLAPGWPELWLIFRCPWYTGGCCLPEVSFMRHSCGVMLVSGSLLFGVYASCMSSYPCVCPYVIKGCPEGIFCCGQVLCIVLCCCDGIHTVNHFNHSDAICMVKLGLNMYMQSLWMHTLK